MNLFVLAWNVSAATQDAVTAALRAAARDEPSLDPPLFLRWGQAFLAMAHTAAPAAAPREYYAGTPDSVVLWDGVAVAALDDFGAHRATDLGLRWDSVFHALEGQFVLVRVSRTPGGCEVITDPLGLHHVYYSVSRGEWLVSNSAGLLRQIVHFNKHDPLGVATMMTLGWAGADRTLYQELRLIPGGQHWVWKAGQEEPEKRAYAPMSALVPVQHQEVNEVAPWVAGSLATLLRQLCMDYGRLTAMLTGGRDSRVIAALLHSDGIPTDFTTGAYLKNGKFWDEDTARDVTIAAQVARTLGSSHRVNARRAEELADWDSAAKRWSRQYAGLVSLCDLTDIRDRSRAAGQLPVFVGGAGGAIVKGFFTGPNALAPEIERRQALLALRERCFHRPRFLFTNLALELLEQYFASFADQAELEGFSAVDLPDLFYAYERLRRCGGSAQLQNRETMDRFQPFCTRPWLEAAFRITPKQRAYGQLHSCLIDMLAPQLRDIPFDKPPAAGESGDTAESRRSLAGPDGSAVEGERLTRRSDLLRQHLPEIRAVCLDQAASPLWAFVNRGAFEEFTRPEACERLGWPSGRAFAIYDIATVFYCDAGA